jgi:hypothetical protein
MEEFRTGEVFAATADIDRKGCPLGCVKCTKTAKAGTAALWDEQSTTKFLTALARIDAARRLC